MKEGNPSDLLERIAGDDAFGLGADDLEALVDPVRFVGRAPQQVDRFLERWVDPVLTRFPDEDGRLSEPDVRV